MIEHKKFGTRLYYALKLLAGIGEGEKTKGWFWVVRAIREPIKMLRYIFSKWGYVEVSFMSRAVRVHNKWFSMEALDTLESYDTLYTNYEKEQK